MCYTTQTNKQTNYYYYYNYDYFVDNIKHFSKNVKELEPLIQSAKIYSEDIGMEFGIEECTMLKIRSGK